MPEGDTIYRTARALQKALGGKVVTGFETGFAKLASTNDDAPVVGRMVEKVFSGDMILVTHMLMSGSWHLYRIDERWRLPRRAMRVVVRVEDFEAVLFNAQIAEFHTARSLERSSQVPRLGPDILSGEFTLAAGIAAVRERIRTHPDDEVGNMLLNQRVMAGLGNVYKSEVAFAVGVNPFRAISTLTEREIEKMVEVAQRYMKANIADGASHGESGEGIVTYTGARRTTRAMSQADRVWVYRRSGIECRRCGAIVMMRRQGTGSRSTYWCPECQP
jgi:endonuclease-8